MSGAPAMVANGQTANRIAKGWEVDPPYKYPFQVSIFGRGPSTGHSCGGTLITEWHVLTAGHCTQVFGGMTNDSFVIVGEHNIEDGVNEGGQNISVAEYYRREDHTIHGVPYMANDIGILKLAEKIKLGSHVGLVEWRDSPSARYDGQVATAIGWGRLRGSFRKPGQNHSEGTTDKSLDKLQEVEMTLLPQSDEYNATKITVDGWDGSPCT